MHPGGTLFGDTTAGTAELRAVGRGCNTLPTEDAPELVYHFAGGWQLKRLVFSTEGSAIDTVVDVRAGDCNSGWRRATCSDDVIGTASQVVLHYPEPLDYFAVVDGKSATGGAVQLSISGEIIGGAPCEAADPDFVCEPGYQCEGGLCAPAKVTFGTGLSTPVEFDTIRLCTP